MTTLHGEVVTFGVHNCYAQLGVVLELVIGCSDFVVHGPVHSVHFFRAVQADLQDVALFFYVYQWHWCFPLLWDPRSLRGRRHLLA